MKWFRHLMDILLFYLYGRVPPDVRFQSRYIPLSEKPHEAPHDIQVDGVTMRVYDLRPGLERFWQMRAEERRRNRWGWLFGDLDAL